MKKEDITLKSVIALRKTLKKEGSTLNRCLQVFNYVDEENPCIFSQPSQFQDTTIGELLTLMGCTIQNNKMTYAAIKEFWTLRIGHSFALYRATPVLTKDDEPVYVENKKGELVRLTVWTKKEIGNNDWTPAIICKGIEQNFRPSKEEAKHNKQLEDAKKAPAYFIKDGKQFVAIKKEEVVF